MMKQRRKFHNDEDTIEGLREILVRIGPKLEDSADCYRACWDELQEFLEEHAEFLLDEDELESEAAHTIIEDLMSSERLDVMRGLIDLDQAHDVVDDLVAALSEA